MSTFSENHSSLTAVMGTPANHLAVGTLNTEKHQNEIFVESSGQVFSLCLVLVLPVAGSRFV